MAKVSKQVKKENKGSKTPLNIIQEGFYFLYFKEKIHISYNKMGMYSSFKLIAVIEKPYRQWINNLIHNEHHSLDKDEYNIHKYINHLYFNNGGFFNVENEYSQDTGIIICGGRLKNYGHNLGDGDEIDFCIKNSILPFGEIIEYCMHNDDLCCDCICTPQKEFNFASSFNDKKEYYLNKYKVILEKFEEVPSSNLKDKMKEFLKKDIESILNRYVEYNFNLTELKKSLQSL